MLSTLFSKKAGKSINWKSLVETKEIDEIDRHSIEQPVLIFKHSTRCAISSMVLNKFERNFSEEINISYFLIDVIGKREISNEIEGRYGIAHQSPQALLISNGKVIYESSHTGIVYSDFLRQIQGLM